MSSDNSSLEKNTGADENVQKAVETSSSSEVKSDDDKKGQLKGISINYSNVLTYSLF